MSDRVQNVSLADGAVRIIDQTRLPGELVYLDLRTREEMYEAIHSLRVRGAPAIGIFAAYAVYVLAERYEPADFFEALDCDCDYLISSRPTAVNLACQTERMRSLAHAIQGQPTKDILSALRAEAIAIHREDIAMCRAIAEAGLSLLHPGDTVLTHCNAGPLATSEYGTGLGPLMLAAERGMDIKAYVDETRPLLQGARLTAWELQNAGIDCTLICDNMAALAMQQGKIQAVLAGCDRMAANGDAANKIGTMGAAILAKHFGVPVYILLPSSTIDLSCATGADIPIEYRDGEEIRSKWYTQPMAPTGVKCWNPAFDVTDHTLITAIVTEKGVLYPPYEGQLAALFGNKEETK
ncbi:MAG: S-methyl-5-thioribose-1-phosphate isomerase [Oscillospiraceae bacterium]|nr:S-methyl-5-thioribose-1-phosphate isomerase [Oscillospiraceae bacterium]